MNAVLLGVATVAVAAWGGLAIWFQIDGAVRWAAFAVVLLAAALMIGLAIRGARAGGWAPLLAGVLVLGLWWSSILPSNDRDWAPDVARGVTAQVEGREVTVHNVRDFDWRSEDEGEERWQTRRYNLDDLTSLDLISSTWGMPGIAHTLMSFGFRDGRHLVFSAEIRRERGEAFSEIGGLFKEFELVLIAADERDIIRLRTNMRGEEVSLFPLNLTPQQREELFLSYLDLGNELAYTPRFYQTVTTNCTTVIFKLARLEEPGLPLDWRIVLSGYLPGYLQEIGLIDPIRPLEEVEAQARISERAKAAGDAEDFSARIRSPQMAPETP